MSVHIASHHRPSVIFRVQWFSLPTSRRSCNPEHDEIDGIVVQTTFSSISEEGDLGGYTSTTSRNPEPMKTEAWNRCSNRSMYHMDHDRGSRG